MRVGRIGADPAPNPVVVFALAKGIKIENRFPFAVGRGCLQCRNSPPDALGIIAVLMEIIPVFTALAIIERLVRILQYIGNGGLVLFEQSIEQGVFGFLIAGLNKGAGVCGVLF